MIRLPAKHNVVNVPDLPKPLRASIEVMSLSDKSKCSRLAIFPKQFASDLECDKHFELLNRSLHGDDLHFIISHIQFNKISQC